MCPELCQQRVARRLLRALYRFASVKSAVFKHPAEVVEVRGPLRIRSPGRSETPCYAGGFVVLTSGLVTWARAGVRLSGHIPYQGGSLPFQCDLCQQSDERHVCSAEAVSGLVPVGDAGISGLVSLNLELGASPVAIAHGHHARRHVRRECEGHLAVEGARNAGGIRLGLPEPPPWLRVAREGIADRAAVMGPVPLTEDAGFPYGHDQRAAGAVGIADGHLLTGSHRAIGSLVGEVGSVTPDPVGDAESDEEDEAHCQSDGPTAPRPLCRIRCVAPDRRIAPILHAHIVTPVSDISPALR